MYAYIYRCVHIRIYIYIYVDVLPSAASRRAPGGCGRRCGGRGDGGQHRPSIRKIKRNMCFKKETVCVYVYIYIERERDE